MKNSSKHLQRLQQLISELEEMVLLADKDKKISSRQLFNASKQDIQQDALFDQMQSRYVDLLQENNMLIMQMDINRKELNEAIEKIYKIENAKNALSNELNRYKDAFPELDKISFFEVSSYSVATNRSYLTCHILDVNSGDLYPPNFAVEIIVEGELVGIKLDSSPEQQIFFPALIKEDAQRNICISYGSHDWGMILKLLNACQYCLEVKPASFKIPKDFNIDYWRRVVIDLQEKIQALPNMFRFDRIELKSEYVSDDYESLSLEFFNVSFENFKCDKFDLRFAASLVDGDHFSRFPKIEIPLVDGVEKPFDSWYPESEDEFGPKFEVRFALDNHSFDLKVWDKLSAQDKSLLTVILLYLPAYLDKLNGRVALNARPWATWMDFAEETSEVFKSFLAAKSNFAKSFDGENMRSKNKGVKDKKVVKTYSIASKKN
jgi:hypothetical protein